MQYMKTEVAQRIIEVAKEEFLENGFEKASIRKITERANTSKSNLYNYFQDKECLFYAVVEPTLRKIYQGLELAKVEASKGIDSYSEEVQRKNASVVIMFVFNHFKDIQLLLLKSQGSSLANFKYQLVDVFAGILYDWVKINAPDKEITPFFVRSIADYYLSIIEQTVVRGISKEEVEKHLDIYIKFIYHGWQGILN
jgi:Transcriptional regulator